MGEGISDYTKFCVDLRRHMWMAGVETELRRLIWQIAVTGKYISAKIHESNRKLAGFKNMYGEEQLALDKSSDAILKNQLQFSGFVREYASEEQDQIIQIGKGQEKYFVTADPLDGSSLVDTNLAIGTIIGIHNGTMYGKGRETMVAALYITYGPLITMVYSAGKGTHEFVLNREGEYVLSQENIRLREKGDIYSLGGLRKDWTPEHLRFVADLEAAGYKLRYSGGFVPDINQVLIKNGGVFTYPALRKSPQGKLRLLFELLPMAFLIEQAGGEATDGKRRILDIPVEEIGQRSPIYIGSRYEVEKARKYLEEVEK
ncbi:MAG TPA: class 1 fructose-bisphosphatase [Syntrophales bacterium]|nr:class 1 fructose-bisphosphatase [Syntrophales bacterium]HOD97776.1 class 1 fructose-bisphosphatase [Syntrophales bacterium]HPN09827.1 class 1 fructose-bisphosphatase [Syntrophales bacterium]HPX82021.1 class 1 fructose-bisphosphatase [Syntrophales bacterium]HQB13982.1 class 1 fructose-bisphosphatase [Syntrophales bacterium]